MGPKGEIPVTQLKGSKGIGDMQAAKRDSNGPAMSIYGCGGIQI